MHLLLIRQEGSSREENFLNLFFLIQHEYSRSKSPLKSPNDLHSRYTQSQRNIKIGSMDSKTPHSAVVLHMAAAYQSKATLNVKILFGEAFILEKWKMLVRSLYESQHCTFTSGP